MFWFKRKPKEKTLDEIIIESFSEEGRWEKDNIGMYTDNKTGAILRTGNRHNTYINDVIQSSNVADAFYEILVMLPIKNAELKKKQDLKDLYVKNP